MTESDADMKQEASVTTTRFEAIWLSMLLLFGYGFSFAMQNLERIKQQTLDAAWDSVKVPLFLSATLCWDTVAVFTVQTKEKEQLAAPRRIIRHVACHTKRARPVLGSLFFCVVSCLVLSDTVHGLYQGAQPVHPFVNAHQ
jgi:hypothetical protein